MENNVTECEEFMNKRVILGFSTCIMVVLSSAFLYENSGKPSNGQTELSEAEDSGTNFLQAGTVDFVESGTEENEEKINELLTEPAAPTTEREVQSDQMTINDVFFPEKQTGQIFLSGELSQPQVAGEEAAKSFLQDKIKSLIFLIL